MRADGRERPRCSLRRAPYRAPSGSAPVKSGSAPGRTGDRHGADRAHSTGQTGTNRAASRHDGSHYPPERPRTRPETVTCIPLHHCSMLLNGSNIFLPPLTYALGRATSTGTCGCVWLRHGRPGPGKTTARTGMAAHVRCMRYRIVTGRVFSVPRTTRRPVQVHAESSLMPPPCRHTRSACQGVCR